MRRINYIVINFLLLMLLSVNMVHAGEIVHITDGIHYNAVIVVTGQISARKETPVVIWPAPLPIRVGVALSPVQLNATTSVPGTLLYSPPDGTVLAAGANQTLSVNFRPSDTDNYRDVNNTHVLLTVNLKDNPVITWANPANITYGGSLGSVQLNATADVPGTFIYNPPLGTVLSAGANQVLSVNFTPTDVDNYSSVNGTQAFITVDKATPEITWSNPSGIDYGTALSTTQLNASSLTPGTFTYTPPIGTILNTGANQTLSLNFSPTDGDNYNVVNGVTALITVNIATPIVTWPPPLPIKVGVPLGPTQLNATADVPGSFVYSPLSGTVLPEGANQRLFVNFTPTDGANYNTVNNTQVQITVSVKDNPVITWANPSDIIYGAVLASAQLNAASNVPGTFIYSPSSGTVFNAGANQVLIANFIPADNVNYNPVISTVYINVTTASLTATASSGGRPYGASNPAFAIDYTGFVNGDSPGVIDTPPTAICTAIVSSPAGSNFPIVPANGTDNNYVFNYINGTLTIAPASLIARPDDASKSYGSANPAFAITYSGFVNGDDPSNLTAPASTTTATPASITGTYPISLSGGTSSNYSFIFQSGTLTIGKALLTATSDNKSKTYGQANPPLTISWTGFVNGESPAVIATLPIPSTTATALSNSGSYPITASGGASTNYDFNYVASTLLVNKAMSTATANNQIRLVASPNPPLTIAYSGFVNGDTPAAIDTPPVAVTAATTASPLGTYAIKVSSGLDNNYNFTYVAGILSVVSSLPPTLTDFLIETAENSKFIFDYALFHKNFSAYAGDSIVSIKIVQPPANGYLFWLGKKIVPGDKIAVAHGKLNDFSYLPNANYSGPDALKWNVFDGTSTAVVDALLSITVIPVNHPPVLSNMESEPMVYDLGDKPAPVTKMLIVSDSDNGFMFGATIGLSAQYKNGDWLAWDGASNPKITSTFDPLKGELVLSGRDTRSNYETALRQVLFSSPVSGDTSLSFRMVAIVVKDSVDESNRVSRIIRVTNAFPELSIVSAFTPNSDKVNDYWDFVNLQFYKEIKIAVFDQNGNRVFDCGDVTCKWDGKTKGKDLPAGAYFYNIDLGSGKRTYRGTVTILK